jgi:hypothetical protein
MRHIKPYDTFILSKDLNPIITRGMQGVVLMVFTENNFEVEFVKGDGMNYEFEGQFTFTIDTSYIERIVDK